MTDITEIQRIIRDYYEQLYANKMANLEEVDKFLERSILPRLSQKEIENMNRSITSNEIESVILKGLSQCGDVGSIPGLGRSRGEGNSNSFQDSCLGNPMDRGAWRATVKQNLATK